jgi:hypothetical protein
MLPCPGPHSCRMCRLPVRIEQAFVSVNILLPTLPAVSLERTMAKRVRKCLVPECERNALEGSTVCRDHEGTALSGESRRELADLKKQITVMADAESADERRKAARRFRERVERGQYALLFTNHLSELLCRASGQLVMKEEIGALRLAIRRLLLEEEDPFKMATGMSRVAHAMARVMTMAKIEIQQDGGERELSDALNRMLAIYGPSDDIPAVSIEDVLGKKPLEGEALQEEMERMAWEMTPWDQAAKMEEMGREYEEYYRGRRKGAKMARGDTP